MTETPLSPKLDDLDKMESLFDEKPTSRLVWIIPSVLLHVLVIVAWLSMPEEEPRVLKDRELVIKSDQAEQLKEFVEDANLQELRMEVSRLQEIKAAMKDIRAEQMTSLKDFEKEMRGSVKGDAREALGQIIGLQETTVNEQKTAIQEMDKLEQLFRTVKPMIDKQDFAQLAPFAKQILDTRQSVKNHQNQAVNKLRELQAQMDNADSTLSWLKDPEIVKKWGEFNTLQERSMELQSESSDKQGQIKYNQERFLQRIAEKGKDYPNTVKNLADQEKKAQEDYDRSRQQFSSELENSAKQEREVTEKLKQVEETFNRNKQEQKVLGDKLKNLRKEKGNEQAQQDCRNQLDKVNQEHNRLKDEINRLNNDKKQAAKLCQEANQRLKRLQAPKKSDEREKLIREMTEAIGSLNGQVGETDQQKEALKVQLTTLELSKDILGKVKIYMEAKR